MRGCMSLFRNALALAVTLEGCHFISMLLTTSCARSGAQLSESPDAPPGLMKLAELSGLEEISACAARRHTQSTSPFAPA